ncbi:MAG: hypothetical protein RMY16_27450 [Nostoc sp. DedQUE12b]|uniref:hypothetical protein n=1 Tax=Nostoc sp. DedQUE12b TaxID=3075398 RepID=UPI002AD41895|nr:hypothetical protein [Nostoc sp. DedQUE12b]MDZ8089257.1 hypothetical protein [Nostoc sp. DedQUE12b]
MASVLFTELTAIEEANLSGGKKTVVKVKIKQISKGGSVKIDDDNEFGDDATIVGNAGNTADVNIDIDD